MSLYSGKKKFPYLYDSMHTIQDLEDMYEQADSPEKKRQIRRLINEKINPSKPKSEAHTWSQVHNFMLFMIKGVRGNMGAVRRRLEDIGGNAKKVPNTIFKRYSAEYREVWEDIHRIQKELAALNKKLETISALRKQDKKDDRANRP